MPDSYVLTGPGGSTQVDVATFTMAEPDFGVQGLRTAEHVEGWHTDGALVVEPINVRKMAFPLTLIASRSISNLGLNDQEALLLKLARPGATLDLRPAGATTAVRFNVLSGRYEFSYNSFLNSQGIRSGTLRLETEPWGYWPTTILLASAASIGAEGALTWTGSVIGDAPALAKISVQPTVASNVPAGSWVTDYVGLAIHSRASHVSFLRAASLSLIAQATLVGGIAFAPGSQAVLYPASQAQQYWFIVTHYDIASALEPAYRGRYRAYAYTRLGPSQHQPWQMSMDAVPLANPSSALGSYAAIATLAPEVATGTPGLYGAQPSPAYTLQDLGEISLPAVASGMGGGQRLRLWAAPATVNVGVATPLITVAGIYLQPLEGDYAGFMPRGLAQPTIQAASSGRLMLDAFTKQALVSDYSLNLATPNIYANAWRHYRGPLPELASGTRLELLLAQRSNASGATAPVVRSAPAFASVSVSYTPRFTFLKGL